MTRQLELSPKMAEFQLAFARARDDELCAAPGIGLILAKHLRWGLDAGAVVIHHSGEGYAMAYTRRPKGSSEADVVTSWERRVAYDMQRASPRADRQQVQQTLEDARRRISDDPTKAVADILGGGFPT